MIIKNKGYAAYLVIVKGKTYTITPEEHELEFDMDVDEHDKLYAEYKSSAHRKVHKLFMKFFSLKKPQQPKG